MALTLEQLQAQREQILNGMGGAQSMTFGDRSMTNRSQQELELALDRVDREIARLSGGSPKQIVITPKGF